MRNLILSFLLIFFTLQTFAIERIHLSSKKKSLRAIFATDIANEINKKEAAKLSSITIVLDPGHGGKDTGAIGPDGTEEKTVVLAIAKKLADRIEQHSHVKVVLTRSTDIYLPLRERLKVARKNNADLFIAIHADAHFDKSASGVSVYALSQRGATSEAARWLAQRENHDELDDIELNSLQDRSEQLRSVLIDLSQTATIRDSLRLGTKVLNALDDISALHYRRVEQAPFVVLKSPDIPSILVETGFITNPKEETRLKSGEYQEKLAKALWQGIDKYINKYHIQGRDQTVLSENEFPFIVRHQLLAIKEHDTAHS